MVKALLLAALLAVSASVAAQHKQPAKKAVHKRHYGMGVVEAPPVPQIYTYVEQAPEFVGGSVALDKYLDKAIHYPDYAHEAGITGKVLVRFMVDEEGKITNATVVKGIGYECDQEALRVVKYMPPWRPGRINGRLRKAMFILPINFKIS